MKECKEGIMYGGSTQVINAVESALEEHLSEHFKWEWRSVVGEQGNGKPIWNFTLYVEPKRKRRNKK